MTEEVKTEATEATEVLETTEAVEPVAEPKELTPEELEQKKQDEENDRCFNVVKSAIEKSIDELYTLEVPVAFIELHAVQLFTNYCRMQTSKSKQWDTFVEAKQKAENDFYSVLASNRVFKTYAEDTKSEGEGTAK